MNYLRKYRTPEGLSDLIMVSDGSCLTGLCFEGSKDAENISGLVDASLLVVRQNMATAEQINDAADTLGKSSHLLGCVFNNVYGAGNFAPVYRYGYGSYGKYGKYGRYGKYGYGKYGYGSYKSEVSEVNS